MNRKLDAAFGARKQQEDTAAEFLGAAQEAKKKKPTHKSNGKEALSARRMCLPLTARQESAIDKIAMVRRVSRAAVVREALDLYIKRHQKDIDRYDAFFGEE